MSLYQTAESRKLLARRIVEESAVLLENKHNCLPLKQGRIACFGEAAYELIIGGSGSGAVRAEGTVLSIEDACRKCGLVSLEELTGYYRQVLQEKTERKKGTTLEAFIQDLPDLVASGMIYEFFGKYQGKDPEAEIPAELLEKCAAWTDTALVVLGRATGGEECDRRLKDDYLLLDSEKQLLQKVTDAFAKVVVILNINGLIDLSWLGDYPSIQAVVYIGTPGEQGAEAVARILLGEVNPCGKLAFTMAQSYQDYPSAAHFSFDKDHPEQILEYRDYGLDSEANGSYGFAKSPVTVYQEDIYMGYRYFDTFGKGVCYPFGYGLSYADFSLSDMELMKLRDGFRVWITVRNESELFAGKEVVQLYVSKPAGRLEQPYQEYLGCVKTALLQPQEEARVEITVGFPALASFDQAQSAWVLEPGKYWLRVGNSSRNTSIAGCIVVQEELLCEQCFRALPLQEVNEGKIPFLSVKAVASEWGEAERTETDPAEMEGGAQLIVRREDVWVKVPRQYNGLTPAPPVKSTLADVKHGKVSMAAFLSQMSNEELAVLLNGYGPGLPFGGMGVQNAATIFYADGSHIGSNTHPTGGFGYVSPALRRYGIPSAYYKDGPAGVGKTAWPTAMTLACSFDTELFYAFGAACGYEAAQLGVDSWLAPGLNLHRNPLGGRNFEYFSEDPVVSGICGMYICRGAEEQAGVTTCPKHFALNEQETYRRGSARLSYDAADSIVSERAMRQLYLKPFELVVRHSPVRTIMTSFNKINGVFAGGSHDLCTRILRQEWDFRGVVVTDWGDMDIVVDGADAVAAGNDVVMPGGPPVIAQVLRGLQEERLSREEMMEAASHLLHFVMHSPAFEEYSRKT